MKLLYYPNPILATPCAPVTEFNDELHAQLGGMVAIMEQHKGIGLSANQVGISKQFFIMKDTKGVVHEFINPTIIDTDGFITIKEGCLSAPNIYLNIERNQSVVVEFQDRHGEKKRVMAEGIDSRVIQHEAEHLSGSFYFSKVNRATRKIAISELKKRLK